MGKSLLYRIIFFAVVCFLLLCCLFAYKAFFDVFYSLICLIFCMLPVAGYYFLNFLAKRFNWNKLTKIVAGVLLIIFSLFYWFVVMVFTLAIDFFDSTPTTPSKSGYEQNLRRIAMDYTSEYFKHFPKKLPEDISDYYFFLENSFDGYDVFYLRFTKDKDYVDAEISQKCPNTELLTAEQLPSTGHTEYISRLSSEGAKEYCIIHKSNWDIPNNAFTSGIATNSDHDTIYYFSTNY